MEFKHFRLEAVIRGSSNKRKNERWRKQNPRDQLKRVTVGGREFGLLVNPKSEPDKVRDIRISLALGGGARKQQCVVEPEKNIEHTAIVERKGENKKTGTR